MSPTPSSRWLPRDRPVQRVVRCVFGLSLFGLGIPMIIQSNLGASPWDVFHTGVTNQTGISVGVVTIAVGVLLLLLWIPLKERPGLGTILNALLIGMFVDVLFPYIEQPSDMVWRIALLVVGTVIIGIGSGFYIGAGLGAGPRDGIMTALSRRSLFGKPISIRAARTGIEVTALAVGIVLGGVAGVGTAFFAIAIGPLAQLFLPPLTMRSPSDS